MGIIKRLIKRTEHTSIPAGMVDIHCHILPGIDDGAVDMAMTIAMANIAVRDGIAAIIATPHFNGKQYDFARIVSLTDEVNKELASQGIPLMLYPGAEISAFADQQLVENVRLNSSAWVLLEFCHSHLPENADRLIGHFLDRGCRVIIAHPERNPTILSKPDILQELLGKHVCCQLTAGSLTGEFGPDAQRCAMYLLQQGWVDFIATDAHSSTQRIPKLSEAFRVAEKVLDYNTAVRLVRDNPSEILYEHCVAASG